MWNPGGAMSIAPVLEPCNIREVWDKVRPGLEEIKAQWPDTCAWLPEDVYAKVLYKDAVLYYTEDGFAVCTIETDEYSGEVDFFIWIAWSPEDKRGGMLKKYWTSFTEVAESLGCTGVSTGSLHPALKSFRPMTEMYTKYRYKV
jgi:hypothetical protein